MDAGGRDGLVWSGLVVVAVWETSSYRVLSPQAVKMQPANAVAVSQSVQAAKHRDRSETLRRFGSLRPYFGSFAPVFRQRRSSVSRAEYSYSFLLLSPHAASSLLPGPDPFVRLWFTGSDDTIGFIQGARWYCDLQVSSLVVDDTTRCLVWTSKFVGK